MNLWVSQEGELALDCAFDDAMRVKVHYEFKSFLVALG